MYRVLSRVVGFLTLVSVWDISFGDVPIARMQVICNALATAGAKWDNSHYIKYSPLSQNIPNQSYWLLDWSGGTFPVPQIEINSIAVDSDDDFSRTVYLGYRSLDLMISLQRTKPTSIEVKSAVGIELDFPDNKISLFDLIRHSFTITPSDINCEAHISREQMVSFSALMMKSLYVYSSDATVHEDAGVIGRILVDEQSSPGKRHLHYVEEIDENAAYILDTKYIAPEKSEILQFGYLYAMPALSRAHPPHWLISLTNLLELWDLEKIEELSNEQGWKFYNMSGSENFAEKLLTDPKVMEKVKEWE